MRQASPQSEALIELRSISRTYGVGDTALTALRGIDLQIQAGELLAIVGASGSGKSTLLHILGCLDTPTSGTYTIAGTLTNALDADGLAALRCKHFGFVFQRYQLLNDLTALGNVETPAVYAGSPPRERRERAQALLNRLGLRDRAHHRPNQLSGGQQQRVSIARSLMNGAPVILADEPTGALDSHSSRDLMNLLLELNAEGHTVILVTHDMSVAQYAGRIIEIKDGCIVADRRTRSTDQPEAIDEDGRAAPSPMKPVSSMSRWIELDRWWETLTLAVISASMHRLRTFLTMLGIIVGIASVVCVVGLGVGARQRILTNLSSFGTNTIDIFPGSVPGDLHVGMARTLTLADVDALQHQSFVDTVTPVVRTESTLRYRGVTVNGEIWGVGDAYFRVHGIAVVEGNLFEPSDVASLAQDVVIDTSAQRALFADQAAIGQVILVDKMPARVVGVVHTPPEMSAGQPSIWLPYTSVMSRMTGQFNLQSIAVRIGEGVPSDAAVDGVTSLLKRRHGSLDFMTFSNDKLLEVETKTSDSLSLLISSIAFISLLVGGIGVMNIMLVSVTERIHEIGVRMALGARQGDIRNQFLMEAVMICLFGGLIGIGVALIIGLWFSTPGGRFNMVFSTTAIAVAVASATLVGILFGYMPARHAARLSPVEALARE